MDNERVKIAINILFDNELMVSDGTFTLYQADGVFVSVEDELKWIITEDSTEDFQYYKEFTNKDEAIETFLKGEFHNLPR